MLAGQESPRPNRPVDWRRADAPCRSRSSRLAAQAPRQADRQRLIQEGHVGAPHSPDRGPPRARQPAEEPRQKRKSQNERRRQRAGRARQSHAGMQRQREADRRDHLQQGGVRGRPGPPLRPRMGGDGHRRRRARRYARRQELRRRQKLTARMPRAGKSGRDPLTPAMRGSATSVNAVGNGQTPVNSTFATANRPASSRLATTKESRCRCRLP